MKVADIVLVKFPFSDLESSKKRPALVIASSELTAKVKLTTIAMITSQVDGLKLPGDVLMKNWKQANLLHPSIVRLSKIATVESELIDKTLGHLASPDTNSVQQALKKQFKFWT